MAVVSSSGKEENDIDNDSSSASLPQAQQLSSEPLPSLAEEAAPRPRLVVEFKSEVGHHGSSQNDLTNRIRNSFRPEDSTWQLQSTRGPTLSIRFDPRFDGPPNYDAIGSLTNGEDEAAASTLLAPAQTLAVLVLQTALLLPSLIISRRALNFTWTVIVDYFTGRTFRTTFTKLEQAYLRYYEFPSAIRAMARLGSQIAVLLGLSWAVRWLMIWIVLGDRDSLVNSVLGVAGMDIEANQLSESSPLGLAEITLPCQLRGKGMAWLCSMLWIVTVVGTGHAFAVALSVWGGPLRLQAVAQHAERPKVLIRRIVHHPMVWLRELEEWKYVTGLTDVFRRRKSVKRSRKTSNMEFNPDPLLFPSTWMPLRWLQIFAIAKAFSTDPLNYRWCSPDEADSVIPKLMRHYLIQLALGDEWTRVFVGEKRVGLGIIVSLSYFTSLLQMFGTTLKLDGGAAAMLIPSLLGSLLSFLMNSAIFWNRMSAQEQRQTLHTLGLQG